MADNRVIGPPLALGVSVVTLLLALLVIARYDSAGDQYMQDQLAAAAAGSDRWIRSQPSRRPSPRPSGTPGCHRRPGSMCGSPLGLDGLSLWMFGLSALLMVSSVLVSWTAIEEQSALFYSMLLLLESGCLGVFAARDWCCSTSSSSSR